MPRIVTVLAVMAVLAAACRGDLRESVTFTAVPSNGLLNSTSNAVRTATFSGGYAVTRLRVTATLTKLNTTTYAREARVQVTPPTGPAVVLQPFTTGAFSGSISTSSYVFTLSEAVAPAAGVWTLRFFESFDDPGTDSRWDTFTLTLDDGLPDPPTAVDLGTLRVPTSLTRTAAVTPGLVQWYRFELTEGATGAGLRYLDLDTGGSLIGAGNDTEMALYAVTGVKLAEDDDDGPGNTSLLSFGTGARAGDSQGQDGSLGPGVYYLALAGFDATFGPGFAVGTTNPSVGQMSLRVAFQPTPVEITSVSPTTAREGELVTISGRGFGVDAANLAVVAAQPDGTTVPLRVELATETSLVARVGAVRPNAQPAPLQVWRGAGRAGGVVPTLAAIVPESPYVVAALDVRAGPAAVSSAESAVFIPSPGVVPGWRFGMLTDGAVTVAIGDSWPQNATVRGIMHLRTVSGVRSFVEFPATRIRLGGSPLENARRVADLVASAYAQRLDGVFVTCEAVEAGAGAAVRVRGRDTAGGNPVGVEVGSLDLLVAESASAEALSGLRVSAFGGATVERLGDEVHAGGLGAGRGVTVDAGASPFGLAVVYSPIDVGGPGAGVRTTVWGDATLRPDDRLVSTLVNGMGADQPLAVSVSLPSGAGTTVRVQVYWNGAIVGQAEAAASEVLRVRLPGGGPPRVAGGGFSTIGVPGAWVGFNSASIVRLGETEWTGDQVRLVVPGLAGAVGLVEAMDVETTGIGGIVIQDAATIPPPPPCPADFNEDGGIDGTDVDAFFAAWESGDVSGDVNRDGGIDGSDPPYFFAAWEAGGCPG